MSVDWRCRARLRREFPGKTMHVSVAVASRGSPSGPASAIVRPLETRPREDVPCDAVARMTADRRPLHEMVSARCFSDLQRISNALTHNEASNGMAAGV